MADSIIKKMKGFFTMSKNKGKKTDIDKDAGSVNGNTGFEIFNDSQAPDPGGVEGVLDGLGAPEEETTDEAPAASEGTSEKTEEIKPETEVKTEKTHEKVSRIAKEMNTKGYGL